MLSTLQMSHLPQPKWARHNCAFSDTWQDTWGQAHVAVAFILIALNFSYSLLLLTMKWREPLFYSFVMILTLIITLLQKG